MLKLTANEQEILEGKAGRLKQLALENIVRYATVLGAEELCPVTKATVFCGAHNYLGVCGSDDFDEVFSKMHMALGETDETVSFDTIDEECYTQSCVSPCDQYTPEPFGQSEAFFQKNARFLDQARKAGVNIAGTCSPYLTGWLPVRGEHFVTTESGVTVLGNSLWGAMGNSDGIEAAFWSAICGRTPKWGNHIEANRAGTHLVEVNARIQNLTEWDLLGKAVGNLLPNSAIPVISGNFHSASFNQLRQFCTALAISSSCEMCHIVGITPEARTIADAFKDVLPKDTFTVDDRSLQSAYENTCAAGGEEVDFVSLGCPHYDIEQIRRVATYIEGKTIHPRVHFMVWTVYPIKYMADLNGYTEIIEAAGGHIYTSTCPGTIGDVFIQQYNGLAFDSLKQAGSVRSMIDKPIYFGEVQRCIDAAVNGRWEESYRWTIS